VSKQNLLEDKRILIVDDESDVLETLESLLPMCKIATASSFDEAKRFLETEYFDLAILDIMGVKGYDLLEIAKERDVISVMLTAHALSPEDVVKSYKNGAAFYVPKDKMAEIEDFLNDILEAKEKGRHSWSGWLERFGDFFSERFGSAWQSHDREFWQNISKHGFY